MRHFGATCRQLMGLAMNRLLILICRVPCMLILCFIGLNDDDLGVITGSWLSSHWGVSCSSGGGGGGAGLVVTGVTVISTNWVDSWL